MKRTYVDVIGEYYDNQDDLLELVSEFGLNDSNIKQVLRGKLVGKARKKVIEE